MLVTVIWAFPLRLPALLESVANERATAAPLPPALLARTISAPSAEATFFSMWSEHSGLAVPIATFPAPVTTSLSGPLDEAPLRTEKRAALGKNTLRLWLWRPMP